MGYKFSYGLLAHIDVGIGGEKATDLVTYHAVVAEPIADLALAPLAVT